MVLISYRRNFRKLKLVFCKRLVFALLFCASSWAQANVLFEGYYQIQSDGKPIGYTVQRYSYDKKTKVFSSTYYIKTKIGESSASESLQAKANQKFEPLSYQYTAQVNNAVKTIDATFKGQQMSAVVSDGKNQQTLTKTFPKGTFLSTFLGYLMLQNGYKTDKKFTYKAIAEEEAEAFAGEAWIKDEQKRKGVDAFRIFNKFKGAKFISFVTPQGQVLGTSSPLQKISTELMASPAEATKGFMVANKPLSILFGNVPVGQKNVLAKNEKKSATKALSQPKASDAQKKPEAKIEPITPKGKKESKGQ